mgnify:CR=1 FL=1
MAWQVEPGQCAGYRINGEAVELPPEAGLDDFLQQLSDALGIVVVHIHPNTTAVAVEDLESPAPCSHPQSVDSAAVRVTAGSGFPRIIGSRLLSPVRGLRPSVPSTRFERE